MNFVSVAVTLIANALVVGAIYGGVKKNFLVIFDELKRLETKQDKHNALIERMAKVEQGIFYQDKQIKEIKTQIKEEKK